jgi:hypothetical protein
MFLRKCSRCDEKCSTIHGGKNIAEEFLCENCVKKAIESGEIIPQEEKTYLSISVLKIISIVHLLVSIGFQLYYSGQSEMGSVFLLGISQSILTFCLIWVFIILVETVLKIYEKMNDKK